MTGSIGRLVSNIIDICAGLEVGVAARNSFFAGLTPLEISNRYPQWWKNDIDDGGKNQHEFDFLKAQFERLGINRPLSYHKITQLNKLYKLSFQILYRSFY